MSYDFVQVLTRPPSVPPQLPPVPQRKVDAVANWLQCGQRWPEATAKLLVLLVALWERHEGLPVKGYRVLIAEHIGFSRSLVDVAISQRTAEGLITKRIETVPGMVKQRRSSVSRLYFDPSDELVAVVQGAN